MKRADFANGCGQLTVQDFDALAFAPMPGDQPCGMLKDRGATTANVNNSSPARSGPRFFAAIKFGPLRVAVSDLPQDCLVALHLPKADCANGSSECGEDSLAKPRTLRHDRQGQSEKARAANGAGLDVCVLCVPSRQVSSVQSR